MQNLLDSRALSAGGVPEHLRRAMLESLAAGLAAADPGAAVRARVRCSSGVLSVGEWSAAPRRVVVVGAGKAGGTMAAAVEEVAGDLVQQGVVIVKDGHLAATRVVKLCEAAHPLPDKRGVEATRRIVDLARRAEKGDVLVVVLSGGGSALLTWPAEGLSLGDLQATTDALLRSGASIGELNIVRRHLDRVKGGGLVRLAGPAPVLTLALSDVVGDDPAAIASGPTVADPTTFADACAVLVRHALWSAVPPAVAEFLQRGVRGERADTLKPGDAALDRTHYVLVGSNRQAAEAVVRRVHEFGLTGKVLSTSLHGEAREAGAYLARLGQELAASNEPLPTCLVLAGETTVTVRGPGHGGRNQEAALAAAIALDGVPGVAVACLGTDGGDGPTPAAGAAVDGTTLSRARALGLDAAAHLDRNDSFPFFAILGDQLVTGPTGTNVGDLYCVFAWKPEAAAASGMR